MKQSFTHVKGALFLLLFYGVFNAPSLRAQAVSEIITDYNGFWKSGVGNINPIKPQNSHNLLAFTYNGVRYSTGAGDAILTSNGETFSPQDFQALPFLYFTGSPTSDTYIGLGQLYDGVDNGASSPPPINNIPLYLTDGINGLDIGTCIANIPLGNINFGVSGIQAASIGDGIPDILITQIAQPSGANDLYSFRDANGNIIGTPTNIVLSGIPPVANWVADFYRVLSSPMIIPGGFVKTERPMRLWAADLADFGITADNYQDIVSFRVALKGTSDIAFIAYNFQTVHITPLPSGIALQKEGTYVDSNQNCVADAGDTINYTFTVTNTGDAALTNVTVTDPLITVNGSPINLAAGASNATNFSGSYTITAADVANGSVSNLAMVSATNPENQVINNYSVDPTPISTSNPHYNADCPTCTVTILPATPTVNAPAAITLQGCSTDALVDLPFSAVSVNITTGQFQDAGGFLSIPALFSQISYQDTVSGTCPLTVTRTFTIQGCLSVTVQQTITIGDTVAPTASNPAPVNVEGCGSAFPAPDTAVVTDAADNCATAPTVAFVSDSAPVINGCQETITRTYSVTDTCGNSIEVTQTLTRTNDTVLPTATAPADIVIFDFNQPVPAADVNLITDEADNCGTPTVTFEGDSQPTTSGCQVTIVRTYHVTDACGNILVLNQNIIRNVDTTAPVADLSPVVSPCALTVPAATAVDACAGTITGTTTDPVSFTEPGVYTINWTFDDGNGNVTTAAQTVTIDPSALPQIGDLPAITAQCNPEIVAPVVEIPCSGTSVTGTTTDAPEFNGDGTYTITWHFDFDGTDVTAEQDIILDDTVAPTLPEITTLTFDCTGSATPPVAVDACAGNITGTTTDATTFNAPGIFNITWTYNDGNGNFSSQTQTVIVNGAAPDTSSVTDYTLACPGPANVPTVTDACTGATITGTTTDNTNLSAEGTYVINWTFTYGTGQSVSVAQTVTVDDTTAPAVGTLEDVIGNCQVTAPVATAIDSCAGEIQGTTTDPLTYSVPGTYTITWTFNDGNGNTATATQTVIVNTAVAPTNPYVAVTEECSYTAVAIDLNDPCTGTPVTPTASQTSFTAQGAFTITWTYAFSTGVTTFTQSVTIDDNTAPTVTSSLDDLTQECSISVPTPTATDNCGGNVTITADGPTDFTTPGSYTINWTFTDANGNSVTLPQNVEVTVPGTQAVAIDSQCTGDIDDIVDLSAFLPAGVPAGGTFSDPANTGALQGTQFVAYQIPVGSYTIDYTVSNEGCEQTVVFTVPVDDTCIVLPACTLTVHNAITPNGDGENDTMIIEGIVGECYTDNNIEIYNRWGILVYEARQYDNSSVVFRGQSEGRATVAKEKELPAGTYFYILKYRDTEGQNYEKSGYLYISR